MRFLFDASITIAVAFAVCSFSSYEEWIESGEMLLNPTLTPTLAPTPTLASTPTVSGDYTPSYTYDDDVLDDDYVYDDADDDGFTQNLFIVFFLNIPGSILLSLL